MRGDGLGIRGEGGGVKREVGQGRGLELKTKSVVGLPNWTKIYWTYRGLSKTKIQLFFLSVEIPATLELHSS